MSEIVGILALQGCITPHREHLVRIGRESLEVRTPSDLEKVTRLIMPGGESTTMLRLIDKCGLWEPLRAFVSTQPTWGICAGSILLAQRVSHPEQRSLQALPIHAIRNFYGSQQDSFSTELLISPLKRTMKVDFIRAPKLEPLDPPVKVLATNKRDGENETVLMQHLRVLVSSFHTELGNDSALHEYFCSL